jgi:hypothetical protein
VHPTPAQIIGGIRGILKDVVEPDLSSDYARGRLREVRAVLAQVDWNNAGVALARDNAAVEAMLHRHVARLAGAAGLSALIDLVQATLGGLIPSAEVPTFEAVNARHAELGAVVVALINPLSDWARDHPEDLVAAAFLDELKHHYSDSSGPLDS